MKPMVGVLHPPALFPSPERIAAATSRADAIRLVSSRPHRDELPAIDDVDAVLVTGSTAHAYDEESWMERTASFLSRALDADVPTLGVCFGHQLLAAALGGAVGPLAEPEIGFRPIRLETTGGADRVFGRLPDTFSAFDWHADHVTTPPPGADVVATSDAAIQAFAARDAPAFGIQFHPEFDAAMATTVFDREGVPADDRRRANLADRVERAAVTRRVYDDFFDLVAGRTKQPRQAISSISAGEGGR